MAINSDDRSSLFGYRGAIWLVVTQGLHHGAGVLVTS